VYVPDVQASGELDADKQYDPAGHCEHTVAPCDEYVAFGPVAHRQTLFRRPPVATSGALMGHADGLLVVLGQNEPAGQIVQASVVPFSA
jgi:hypothetical protein